MISRPTNIMTEIWEFIGMLFAFGLFSILIDNSGYLLGIALIIIIVTLLCTGICHTFIFWGKGIGILLNYIHPSDTGTLPSIFLLIIIGLMIFGIDTWIANLNGDSTPYYSYTDKHKDIEEYYDPHDDYREGYNPILYSINFS